MLRRLAALLATVALLAGCAAVEPQSYAGATPRLDLFEYFQGTVDAWGHFAERSGRVTKRFRVVIRGTIAGDTLTLDEDFAYADGSTSKRIWTIRRIDAHRYEGTAGDVVGTASGEAYGNALRWRYVLALDTGERVINVDFDDWMFLEGDGVMLNRSVMSKWGVRVGEVFLAFKKRT